MNYGKNVGSVRPNLIRWGRERDRSRSHPTRERLRFFPPTIMIRFSGLLFALRLRLILTFFAFRFLAMYRPPIAQVTPALYHHLLYLRSIIVGFPPPFAHRPCSVTCARALAVTFNHRLGFETLPTSLYCSV